MKTAGEYRAEAARLRDLAAEATNPDVLMALRDMTEELEARAREVESGSS